MGRRIYIGACLLYGVAAAWVGLDVVLPGLGEALRSLAAPTPVVAVAAAPAAPAPAAPAPAASPGAAWLAGVKPYCNAVEVEIRVRIEPPPEGVDGAAHAAACFALAGRTEEARRRILGLDDGDRWRAAGVVFEAAHPVADAGDDRSAGPIMELVVEFWPNHVMALYHAGAARHALGDRQAAGRYLRRFLRHYPQEDGWRRSAETMLGTPREG